MSDRLTWDSHSPAPYESAWSVFLKILSVNHMTMYELEKLIEQKPVEKNSGVSRFHLDSGWINFDRYASLLGVKKERLTKGFLDQLGITPISSERPARWGIRHCIQCCELGYHCALFDLPIIKECPWHQCKLKAPCTHCSLVKSLDPFADFRIINGRRICPRCAIPVDSFITATSVNAMDNKSKATITRYCREFLDWWAAVEDGSKNCSSFVSTLRNTESKLDFHQTYAPWQLGFARHIANNELHWKFSVAEKPAHVISRTCTIEKATGRWDHYRTDDVGKSFRSIRRHIYHRHLRAHHRCINYLLNLSHDEALFLHSEKVCIPALAFLTWWMSALGISNIEGLRSAKKTSVPLRLMEPYV